MGTDKIGFENTISVTQKLMIADYEKDFEGSVSDGILGLSNYWYVPNIFDIAKDENQLASSTFAFKLGLSQFDQQSYFYYNITNDDFKNASYVKATRSDYWTIPVLKFVVGDKKYSVKQALIDTGTSLILFPSSLYFSLDTAVFSQHCSKYSPYPKLKIKSAQNIVNERILSLITFS